MKNKFSHINPSFYCVLIIFIISVSIFSCSPTKYVSEGDYLLANSKINIEGDNIDKEDLESSLRQKPNRKVFGLRFYLMIHNSINQDKEKLREEKRKIKEAEKNAKRKAKGKNPKDKFYITRWLSGIGEEPVIYDEFATEKSISNMYSYLKAQSYYDAQIDLVTSTKKKKINTTYNIKTGEAWIIRNVEYDILDPLVKELVILDSENSLVKIGKNFNTDILQTERERLVRMMKTNGYYYFTINNIHFFADTIKNKHDVDLKITLRKSFAEDDIYNSEAFTYQMIRNINIYTDYDPKQASTNTEAYLSSFNKESIDGINLFYKDKLQIKPSVVLQSCFLKLGDRYNIVNIEKTHSHLSNLKQFKIINVKLNSSEDLPLDSQKERFLDVNIYLTPLKKQNYSLELEGNNTSGNIGMGAAVTYSNINVVKKAQIFSAKAMLSFQTLKTEESIEKLKLFNTLEYGLEFRVNIPRLLIPFWDNYEFVKNHNPKTQITTSFNYQQRPDYTRYIANAAFGYIWKGGKNNYITHLVNPIELYSVKILDFNPDFQKQIENLYIKYSYQDQLFSAISYNFIYNNQSLTKSRNFSYLWLNLETSGNLPALAYKGLNIEPIDGSYKFLGLEFAQFAKIDLDYRYYQVFDKNHSLVYRGFAGLGLPYGNSTSGLPFIKKYFVGGANDLRAWRVRSIGPGTYSNPNRNYDQIGDMKLVLNLEYRFPLFSILNGAVFLDAGNIWAVDKNDNRAGALFDLSRFYNEIAIGTGLGARIDLSFFILRFDFGIPIHDPSLAQEEKWFSAFKDFRLRNFAMNFGIGYPF
ncbi:MAG: BamA/TamA family outer membrane protein [Bacteroidales bacterium]|nr:BamA/TamA family outer membrane protein [Bacteroidales bacterium]